jgi:hypothetical protein
MLKAGGVDLGGGDDTEAGEDNVVVEESVAPPSLTRQARRTMTPRQPGAVPVRGIDGSLSINDNDDPNENPPSNLSGSIVIGNGPDTLEIGNAEITSNDSQQSGEVHEELSSSIANLPVASAVEAELVNDEQYEEVLQQLGEKDKEISLLAAKLKEMEKFKEQMERIQKTVVTAVPAKQDNVQVETKRLVPKKKSSEPRMSARERYALKALLGTATSEELVADSPNPTTLRRHHSDMGATMAKTVSATGSARTLLRSTSAHGRKEVSSRAVTWAGSNQKGKRNQELMVSTTERETLSEVTQELPERRTAEPTTIAAEQSACCAIL